MQPPSRRKSVQSVKRLLLNHLLVDVEKKKFSVRTPVDIGCTGLCNTAFHRVSTSSSKFCCPLCILGAQEKEIKVLKSCVAELRSSISEHESKLDSVMNPLSMTVSSSGMKQILGITTAVSS